MTTNGVSRKPPAWIECTIVLKSTGVSGPPMRGSNVVPVVRKRYGTSVWFGLWQTTHTARFSLRLAPCRLSLGTTTSPCWPPSWQRWHLARSTIGRRAAVGSTPDAAKLKSAAALRTGTFTNVVVPVDGHTNSGSTPLQTGRPSITTRPRVTAETNVTGRTTLVIQ